VNGPLTLASRRMVWPIITQVADKLVAERTALVAEAAHVLPPIGAQGLNTSLTDLSILLNLATASPDTLGSADMLDTYARQRHKDIKLRSTGIDLLNRASQAENPLLRDLRAAGVNALYSTAPLRKSIMKLGLGARD